MTRLKPSALVARTLADAGDVRVTEVICHAPADAPGAQEAGRLRRLILPLRGVFSCAGRGTSYVLVPGSAMLLEPDEPYRFGHPVDGGDECVVVAMAAEVWAEATATERPFAEGERLVLDSRDVLRTLLFRTAAARLHDDPHAVRELAVLHLGELTERYGTSGHRPHPVPPSQQRAAHAAAAFIAAHYAEPIPRLLDAAAGAAACSPYHLARTFRLVHGVTLHAYRERLRTASALQALADGAENLAQLATSLGYASHGHFTERLRRAVSSSPSCIRATFQETAGTVPGT
ncbi:helix-turn-helix domain-containing protein [Streptomyces sp. N2-109]|uniref:Helix-turn-helix domain-containing protein n=1 Tax=Streptomyces gossypii TaxID=2883101 RepID=A0ABT2JP35_9ACTN|nr:helix-turn-helix domain-containing protein [Streptomyces gossypii]MCT2589626.1 helix-turn-helix domain-containing protein [Streptomyces gossypii]